jgi:hypothetical protein
MALFAQHAVALIIRAQRFSGIQFSGIQCPLIRNWHRRNRLMQSCLAITTDRRSHAMVCARSVYRGR